MQREAVKTERRIISREQKEAEEQRQFELKQQKKKEKHRADSPCTSLSFSESRGDKMLSEIYLNLNYC